MYYLQIFLLYSIFKLSNSLELIKIPTSYPTNIPTLIITSIPSSQPTNIPTWIITNIPSSIPTWIVTNSPSSLIPTNIPTINFSSNPSSNPSSLIPTNIPTWIQNNNTLKFDMSIQFHNFKNPKPDQKDTQIIITSTSKTMNVSTNYISLKPETSNKNSKLSKIAILNYDIIVNLQIKLPIKGNNGLIIYNSLVYN